MADKEVSSKVVVKSGIWYTISNFLFRSIGFITTPIFARVLTKAEYGEYQNIVSWVLVLIIIAACDMHTSIIRAKLDYEDDLECYAFSVLSLASIITVALYVVVSIFAGPLERLFGFDRKYFLIIFLYLFFQEAYQVFITTERARYKYKAFSLITGLSVVAVALFSLTLVLTQDNKLDARVYGQYIPYVIIGICMYVLVAKRGKKINFSYYKYALTLSLPLVPHLLSLVALSASDRIMITKMNGAEFTALYSMAYLISNIIAILLDSMNKAWAPWLLDSLKAKNYDSIKKTTTPYFLIFFAIMLGALIFAPEAILILGGKKYLEAINVVPPLVVACMFQFAYTMYVQLEFYEKKMKTVATGTMVAAAVNIALNFVLIPIFGYVAAGYTSLIGYIVLFLIHYRTICKYGYKEIFDRKPIFTVLIVSAVSIPVFIFLYSFNVIRYVIGAVYIGALVYLAVKNKNLIIGLVKKDLA